jgi:hypothetical protein
VSNTIVFCQYIVILGIQLIVVFCLATPLCENGGTLYVMVKSEDILVPLAIPHLVFEANHMKVSKIQHKPWHAIMAKLHDLPARSAID